MKLANFFVVITYILYIADISCNCLKSIVFEMCDLEYSAPPVFVSSCCICRSKFLVSSETLVYVVISHSFSQINRVGLEKLE